MNSLAKPLSRFARALFIMALNLGILSQTHAQPWSTNNPLQAARWAHTATLLTNGSVLITGGIIHNVNGDFEDTNSCELFDPATGTSAFTDPMQSFRHSHKAVFLLDGTVLVTGGGSQSSEIFDPGSSTWINFTSMGGNRLAHALIRLPNGQVLAAAGFDDNAGHELATAELYDPATGTWSATGSMPYASDSIAAVLLPNGRVLVCGGSDGGGGAITNAALYNPATQTWTNAAPLQVARASHAAVVLSSGKVLVVGGSGDNSAEVYDPAAGTWSYVAAMDDGYFAPVAVLLNDGTVMVTGDANPDVDVYDPIADSWSLTDPLPVPGYQQTATVLPGGPVVVTGGSQSQFNGPPIATIQIFGSTLSNTPSLTVTASPSSGVVPLTVHFTSPGADSLGNTVTNWNWDFGDGSNGIAQSPTHTYTNSGSFSPVLTAYSTYGSTPLSVSGPGGISVQSRMLTVSASPTTGPLPLSVQFTSPAVDNGGSSVTNWSWDFGDGGTSTAQNPTHVYIAAGSFLPSLTAHSTYGPSALTIDGLGFITVTNTPNPSFHTLYTFTPPFGSNVSPGLLLSGNTLYGTASGGGSSNLGTMFSLSTDGSGFTNLYSFDLNHGCRPTGQLILSGPTLYGTAGVGGVSGGGTVFGISTNGVGFTNVCSFTFNVPSTGESPTAGLVLTGNTLYGTTEFGGAFDHGTIFNVTTNGAGFSDLHSFSNPSGPNANLNGDGLFPITKLIISGGTLYGTAEGGGNFGRGTVFAVDTNSPGSFRTLHNFTDLNPGTGTNADGAHPFAGLVLSGNTLYGTTRFGGKNASGSVFAVNTDGSNFTNLYHFTGGADGAEPLGELTVSGNTLYGSTTAGGTSTNGTLFSLHTDGSTFTTLYNFTGGTDGGSPTGDLLLSAGALFGTAATGGSGNGAVFSFTLPQAPPLAITRSGTNVILSWPTNFAGFSLQITTNLNPAAWFTISGQNAVTNPSSGKQLFYRLIK